MVLKTLFEILSCNDRSGTNLGELVHFRAHLGLGSE
jgi:hypothetical protein